MSEELAPCQCAACSSEVKHMSDCAVHNGPAYAIGPCDCGRGKPVRKVQLPNGLAAFSPHVKTEYANGWNTFRERLIIALKSANVEVEP